ncbi:hypothetical protein ACFY3U_15945 [Micromonospora sp. NPDC000089]|uniref:hypothetical protein n=1 Tax=unclassified Micromonospora TaxID=2617518 RepID=UPI0036A6E703
MIAFALAAAGVGLPLAVSPFAHADDVVVEAAEVTVPPGGTNCEAAFVVKDFGGTAGNFGLISAGHCDTPGHVLLSSNADSDFEVVATGVNKFIEPKLPNGSELFSANFFRAGADNRGSWGNADRTGAVNPTSIGTAALGQRVCRFGGVTGHTCGTVTSTNAAPRGTGFAPDTFGYLRLDIPCAAGDSGAAVLNADFTQAIGIVSGRRLSDGACFVSQLSRVVPKVSGLALYQPPGPNQKYHFESFLDGKWFRIGVETPRDRCAAVLDASAKNGIDSRCVPA